MLNHMNVFHPYDRIHPGHENQLTRAFLLVVRSVPLAQAAWMHLVDKGHKANQGSGVSGLHELSAASISTQTASIEGEFERVVSVIQTDENYFVEANVKTSDRLPVLDGVVAYPSQIAIAIENKPSSKNIWEAQLTFRLQEGVALDPRVACVTWRSIVSAWTQLMQADHLGRAERVMVEDFLDYVEEHFPRLQPFDRIGLCGNDSYRLNRRCRAILESIAPGQVKHATSWGWYIGLPEPAVALRVALIPRQDERGPHIDIEIAPADTVGQAKRLYDTFEFKDTTRLTDAKWKIHPNFHLAFMQGNFWYPSTSLDAETYWTAWKKQRAWIRQVPRKDWDELLTFLFDQSMAKEEDKAQFDIMFTNTRRQHANVCPGLICNYTLTLDEASLLDSKGILTETIRREVNRAGEVFGLPLAGVLAPALAKA